MPMVEGCEDSQFTLETSHALSIAGKRFREDLQRHVAPETRIGGAVHSPIPPTPIGPLTLYGPSLVPVRDSFVQLRRPIQDDGHGGGFRLLRLRNN